MFQTKLVDKKLNKASIGRIKLKLIELSKLDAQFQKIREEELKKDWKDVVRMLHHQELPFIFEII